MPSRTRPSHRLQKQPQPAGANEGPSGQQYPPWDTRSRRACSSSHQPRDRKAIGDRMPAGLSNPSGAGARRSFAGAGTTFPFRVYEYLDPVPLLADLAIPAPLAHAFTYAVPEALAARVLPEARVLPSWPRITSRRSVRCCASRCPRSNAARCALEAQGALPSALSRTKHVGGASCRWCGRRRRKALPAGLTSSARSGHRGGAALAHDRCRWGSPFAS